MKYLHFKFLFSYVFWFGDLNFRLEGDMTAKEIDEQVQKKNLSELFKLDELTNVRESGEAFSELHEETPQFNPTYKNLFGKTAYDMG